MTKPSLKFTIFGPAFFVDQSLEFLLYNRHLKVIITGQCRDVKTCVYMYGSSGRKIEDHCRQVAISSGLTVALVCGKIDLKINGSVVKMLCHQYHSWGNWL